MVNQIMHLSQLLFCGVSRMNLKRFALLALAPLSLLLRTEIASAHLIQTDYTLHLDGLEIQATFGDGKTYPNAPVAIYSPENPDEPIFIGRTDSEGKFKFKPDQQLLGDWAVEIGDAETSHWDYLVVPVNEVGVALDAISNAEIEEEEHHHGVITSILSGTLSLTLLLGVLKVFRR